MDTTINTTDIAIIGAGAAGLSAAAYGARAGASVTVLEQMAPGGQLMIIDQIENYPGFDTGISGFELAGKFEAHANAFGARIEYAEVSGVQKEGDTFVITSSGGTLKARALILATGAAHRSLDVPGEKEYFGKGVSYCATCDGPLYRKKKILVVGGGDSAVQETLYLANLSDQVTIIHRRDRFRAQAQLVDRLSSNSNVRIVLSTTLQEIKGDGKHVSSAVLRDEKTMETREESFDAIFGFVGIIPQTQVALQLGLELDQTGYIKTDEQMKTSMPGVFAAGDVRNTPFRQVVTACADGAVAAHQAQEYIDSITGNSYTAH